jgi:hypothetical protein
VIISAAVIAEWVFRTKPNRRRKIVADKFAIPADLSIPPFLKRKPKEKP